ncbi:TPA: Leucine-rich repeat receptor-like serine/threonine-protein kinase bam2 [Trebouxia sp. C0005]
MVCIQPQNAKPASHANPRPISTTLHCPIHCHQLKPVLSRPIRESAALTSSPSRLPLAKHSALQHQANKPHLVTRDMSRSCAQSTTCASTAAPMQQEAAAVRTAPWEPEQAAADLLLAEPQRRQGVPVYVMLPLDTVNNQGHFQYASTSWFARALGLLRASGVEGIAVDVWWGAVERQPGCYDWSGYQQLFSMVKAKGLRIQAVMSFHACGGNVGDYAQVPLPEWVLKCAEEDPSFFCTDRPRKGLPGTPNNEYISLFADQASVLHGRTALECYADFMHAFREAFIDDIGAAIHEIAVGGGPCGELRYPSYVETQGWRFPGAGEFQCYDRRALASLAEAAAAVEQPEWGKEGPMMLGNTTAGQRTQASSVVGEGLGTLPMATSS